ncbi:hypothetical protein AB0E01_32225 [Nocardia vinacea]|uniref:hypothetical protein n=1 Tax=Nocardia vinacea TaxID=96468 RepID=UPI0033C3C888
MRRAFETVRHVRITPVAGESGLFTAGIPMMWLGTRPARDEAYDVLARSMRQLAELARATGGVLAAPGLGTAKYPAVLGGDTHVLEVLSSVEQEVLCNLLRTQVPALIALFGRGITVAGAPRDRIGSRWLAGSRSHLATRFLASTAPEHLERVKAELRRRDGVALLDRMDVYPAQESDGTMTVVVRCLDSAATLAGVRAQALLLAALAMQARRMVRDGRRVGNAPQRILEDNRARAVADGLRARLVIDDKKPVPRGRSGPTARSADRPAGSRAEPRMWSARDAARAAVRAAAVELRNLDADAAELAPVLLPLDLPDLGVKRRATEVDLLAQWAASGDSELLGRSLDALTDSTVGGPLLARLNGDAPSQTSIVLGSWRTRIAQARAEQGGGQHRQGRPNKRSQPGRQGQRGGTRSDRRAEGGANNGIANPHRRRDNRRRDDGGKNGS